MQTQLVSFSRWLFSLIYALLSNPQRVRLILAVITLCFVLAALVLPSVTILADPISGGTGH